MAIRLNKVLSELNIGIQTAVDFLKNKKELGEIKDEMTPNAEISDKQYQALITRFKVDFNHLRNGIDSHAPIAIVMGHSGHGKTSLLDFISKTNVIAGETSGITQHINDYNVKLKDGRRITFLDDPGHETFTAMHTRGAQTTYIAIIIIAADDSVRYTTKEAIAYALEANIPIIFAINKIDKPDANPDKIREDLADLNLLVEEWGGKYKCQEISTKKGIGVDELLEKVLLEAEMYDMKDNPNCKATDKFIDNDNINTSAFTISLLDSLDLSDKKVDNATPLVENYEKEDPEELCDKAKSYEEENPPKYDLAMNLYKKACEYNSPRAFFRIGRMYEKGLGVAQDGNKALEYYLKASEWNYVDALYNIGCMYGNGDLIPEDYKKSFEYHLKASELGDADATYVVGELYKYGLGVDENESKACEYLFKASEMGNAEAIYQIGTMYEEGDGFPQDTAKAFEYYLKASELGHVDAAFNVGVMYHKGEGVPQNYSKAFEYYLKASEMNHETSTFNVGVMYNVGQGVVQNKEKAFEYFMRASELGNAVATNFVGCMYDHGDGVQQSCAKAIEYFQKASDMGSLTALVNLGIMYENGRGNKLNYHKALEYYQEAAMKNYPDAFYHIARFYECGLGIRRNKKKAMEIYLYSSRLGVEEAEAKIEELVSKGIVKNEFLQQAQEILEDYIKDEIKDCISDIVSNAVDKIVDEEGSIIGDAIGDAVAEVIMAGFDD